MTDYRLTIGCLLAIALTPPSLAQPAEADRAIAPTPQSAEPPASRLYFGVGSSYSSGDYGAAQDTRFSSQPLTLGWSTNRWALQVSISHLHRRGPAGSVVVPGDGVISPTPTAPIDSASGWGDTWLSATRYYLLDQYRSAVNLHLRGGIKLATGPRDKGLSTGEHDASLGAEITRFWGSIEGALATSYTVAGRAPGLALRNFASGRAILRWTAREALVIGVGYHVGQRLAQGGSPVRDASLSLDLPGPLHGRLNLYVLKGFSDGSPDSGAGAWLTWTY